MEQNVYLFEIEAGLEFWAESDKRLDVSVVSTDWFDDWLFTQYYVFSPGLYFGCYDEENPRDPGVEFINVDGETELLEFVEDPEQAEPLGNGSSVKFLGFEDREDLQFVWFIGYTGTFVIGIKAESLEDAKEFAKGSVRDSFFVRMFGDNYEIEFLDVTSLSDSELVVHEPTKAPCDYCGYRKEKFDDVCTHCNK